MSPKRRIVLFGLGGMAMLALLVVAALLLIVDRNAYKARLEEAASRSLGMDVGIGGPLSIELFPRLTVNLADVHGRIGESEVLSTKQATIGIGLASLLGGEIRIERIGLKAPTVTVARDRHGRFNVEKTPAAAAEPLPPLDLPEISFSEATFVYADDRFGKRFVASGCNVAMRGLHLPGGPRAGLLKALAFHADLRCAELRKDAITLSDLRFTAVAKDGVVGFEPVTAQVFDAPGAGSLHADFSGPAPAYRMAYKLSQFPIEAFFKAASMKPLAAGRLDLTARLSTHGKTLPELQQALSGAISLRGKGLVFAGGDLDQAFARYESSQTFDLVDIGAVFLAGPLGLVITKGYDFANLAKGTEGSSEVRTLVSDWTVDRGVAQARDVAMATPQNRLALQGRLDFVHERFDEVSLALLDAKGCARVRQRIRGTFAEPVVEKPNLLESLAGPAIRLFKKGGELLGADCEVFYAGSVAAP